MPIPLFLLSITSEKTILEPSVRICSVKQKTGRLVEHDFGLFGRCYVVEKCKCRNWCHLADVFLTVSTSNVDQYKLKGLVQYFNLSGSLLA